MKPFKNIIFDFGGVIINIDYHLVPRAFESLGVKNFHELYSQQSQMHLLDDFEKGLIEPDEFRNQIRRITKLPLTDGQIDNAWNALLLDLPPENIELLLELKKKYRLFLLSNANTIHEEAFTKILDRDFEKGILESIFERLYFSHHIQKRKPDSEIFRYVLEQNSLLAEETLFIDDSPQHIEGAKEVGLQTLLLEKGQTISDLFKT